MYVPWAQFPGALLALAPNLCCTIVLWSAKRPSETQQCSYGPFPAAPQRIVAHIHKFILHLTAQLGICPIMHSFSRQTYSYPLPIFVCILWSSTSLLMHFLHWQSSLCKILNNPTCHSHTSHVHICVSRSNYRCGDKAAV